MLASAPLILSNLISSPTGMGQAVVVFDEMLLLFCEVWVSYREWTLNYPVFTGRTRAGLAEKQQQTNNMQCFLTPTPSSPSAPDYLLISL